MNHKAIFDKAMTLGKNHSIRLTAEPKSYTLFNFDGKLYIGSYVDEPMPLYNQMPVRILINNKGKESAKIQRLLENQKPLPI